MPSERNLFSSDKVKPSWATGSFRTKTIFGWQLDSDTCPYLSGNTCSNYEHRPTSCKAYPVQILHGLAGVEASVDVRCTAAKKLSNQASAPAVEIFGDPLLQEATFISDYLRLQLRTSRKTFVYDLEFNTWKLFTPSRARAMMVSDAKRVMNHV